MRGRRSPSGLREPLEAGSVAWSPRDAKAMTNETIDAIEKMLLIVFGGVVATIGGYWGQRFKNAAMKDDFEDIKEQTRQLAEATREIETKIDDQVWNRQRLWEMKREIMFKAVKRLNDVENNLLSLEIFWQNKPDDEIESQEAGITFRNGYLTSWQKAMRSFEELEALTQVACSLETMRAFTQLGNSLRATAARIVNGDKFAYTASMKERYKLSGLAKAAIRRELGVPTSVMPLTSAPSAPEVSK